MIFIIIGMVVEGLIEFGERLLDESVHHMWVLTPICLYPREGLSKIIIEMKSDSLNNIALP